MRALTKGLTLAAAVSVAMASSQVMAYEKGDIIVRAGATTVAPDASSALPNTDITDETQLGLTATYMLSKRLGVELLAATPFNHTVKSGGVSLVEAKQLPPTLSAVYYLTEGSALKPYVGAGLNYTTFFNEKETGLAGNEVKLEDSWGLAFQVGVDYELSDKLHLNASVRYIDIETEVKVNGVKATDAKIDPIVYSIMVGYKF